MHTSFCYYCLFCPVSILLHTLNSTLYFVLFRTEDDRKHVFKEMNVLYKTIKANLHVKCSSPPQTKQTVSLVSMFLLNLS